MTNVNFSFSSELAQQLHQTDKGIYVYAVSFYGPGGTIVGPKAELVKNGDVQTGNLSMSMPTNFPSGVVYVVVQQGGDGSLLNKLTTIGSITPASAATNNYSYQLYEASLSPSPFDQGDISALNTFGFPSS